MLRMHHLFEPRKIGHKQFSAKTIDNKIVSKYHVLNSKHKKYTEIPNRKAQLIFKGFLRDFQRYAGSTAQQMANKILLKFSRLST